MCSACGAYQHRDCTGLHAQPVGGLAVASPCHHRVGVVRAARAPGPGRRLNNTVGAHSRGAAQHWQEDPPGGHEVVGGSSPTRQQSRHAASPQTNTLGYSHHGAANARVRVLQHRWPGAASPMRRKKQHPKHHANMAHVPYAPVPGGVTHNQW